jgi:hypothetical protein
VIESHHFEIARVLTHERRTQPAASAHNDNFVSSCFHAPLGGNLATDAVLSEAEVWTPAFDAFLLLPFPPRTQGFDFADSVQVSVLSCHPEARRR